MKFENLQQVADQLDRIALAVETSKKYGTAPVLDEGQLREMALVVRATAKVHTDILRETLVVRDILREIRDDVAAVHDMLVASKPEERGAL